MGDTFITNIEPMKEVLDNTENNLSCFLDISDEIVTKYSKDLDELLNNIKQHTINNECSDDQIERYILELSNMLYFVGQKLEIVGIRDDLSSLMAKEVYNNSYINNSLTTDKNKKATVAELNVKAEEASRYQTVLNKIYSRTYKQLKCKIDAAYEMLASLRKVLSKRMLELQLNMSRNTSFIPSGNGVN